MFRENLYFHGGTLTTNRWPLAVSVVCPLGAVNQQFYVILDRFVVCHVFLSTFDGSIVTISMDRSTRFRRHWRKPKMAQTSRRKCVLLSILIVTIDPSKDTEKYIADDEAIWSNIKVFREQTHSGQCLFVLPNDLMNMLLACHQYPVHAATKIE